MEESRREGFDNLLDGRRVGKEDMVVESEGGEGAEDE